LPVTPSKTATFGRPPAADNTAGPIANFGPTRPYSWLAFDLQPGAVFTGTFDPAAVSFNTAQFANATNGGVFALARSGNQVFVTFTPVPEPAHTLGLCAAALAAAGWWRRKVGQAQSPCGD
jgi:hypothetical protein